MKFGFIGAGNMAYAIAMPLNEQIYISDKFEQPLEKFNKKNIKKCKTNIEVVENSDFVFFCIKPQDFEEMFNEIKNLELKNKVFITIAAGITSDYIIKNLGEKTKVIRVMPNTPMLIKKGAIAICKNEFISADEFKIICDIFQLSGIIEVIDEDKMNQIIAINGSSPAYIYYLADIVSDYGEKQGINKEISLRLFCQTLIGSAEMMLQTDDTPKQLLDKVCSKGGTTIEAINTFDRNNLNEIFTEAMENCTKRAIELNK